MTYSISFSMFFFTPPGFPLITIPCLLPVVQNQLPLSILEKDVTKRKSPFLSIQNYIGYIFFWIAIILFIYNDYI